MGVAPAIRLEEVGVWVSTATPGDHPLQGSRGASTGSGEAGGEGATGDRGKEGHAHRLSIPLPQTVGIRVFRVRGAALAVRGGGALGGAFVHLCLVHGRVAGLEELEQLLSSEPRGNIGHSKELCAGIVHRSEGGEEELE